MVVWVALGLASELSVTGACPGVVDLVATGLTPSGKVAVVTGDAPGADLIPGGACAGGISGVSGLVYRGRFTADAAGGLARSPTVGAPDCGTVIQLVDLTTCTPTDVASFPVPPLSYAADVAPLLVPSCGGCHGNSGGFTLSYADLLANSVDVPSMAVVEPFAPAASYLWHKLQGTQAQVGGAGGRMPPAGPLPADALATVERWILDGALP